MNTFRYNCFVRGRGVWGGRKGRGKETRRKWKIKDEKMANDEDKDKEGTRKTRRQERGKGEESRRREIFKEKPVNGRRKRREKRTKQNDSIKQENNGKSLDKVSKNNQKGMQKKEHQRFIKQPSQKKKEKNAHGKRKAGNEFIYQGEGKPPAEVT